MLDQLCCTFLRHAVRWWYADLTAIKEHGGIYYWQACFCKTLEGFRDAVVRHAAAIRRHHVHRQHTNLQEVVPESERQKFTQVVSIAQNGAYTLTNVFTSAISNAQSERERLRSQQQGPS